MQRLAIAGFALATAFSVHGQSTVPSQSSGFLLGRVIDAASNVPVAGAIVRLTPESKQPPVLTGPDGYFLFSPLSPGFYTIDAGKPGFFGGSYGQMRVRGAGTKLLLGDGMRRGDVIVRLWPWASISGRVLDEDGRPMAGVPVEAVRRAPNDLLTSHMRSTRTNAHGRYTLTQLAPGRWIVGAGCGTMPMPLLWPRENVTEVIIQRSIASLTTCGAPATALAGGGARIHPLTLYPEAESPDAALAIPLASGESVDNIDIRVRPEVGYRVAGTVIGPQGPARAPVQLIHVGWSRHDASPFGYTSLQNDGTFVFSGVRPGAYVLRSPPNVRMGGEIPITVDRDLADLVLTLRPGVSVAGQITSQAPVASGIRIALGFNKIKFEVLADESGSFLIPQILPAGRYDFFATSLTADWHVAAVTLGGRSVLGATIDVGDRGVSGLVVHLADAPASVVGEVADPRGAAAAEPSVVLFPADSTLWPGARDDHPLFRSERTWAGLYAFERVPPGDYLIAAVDDAALEEWPDVALLARLGALARRIHVQPGQQRHDLRVEIGFR